MECVCPVLSLYILYCDEVKELTMYVVGILAQTRFARTLKQMVSSFKGFQPVEVSLVMGAKYIGGGCANDPIP